ncbi:MAG: cytochrome c4 [Burkholderiaceae bacterium]|nr:cytochrome c4 [Burkholderiaceae bacterium]
MKLLASLLTAAILAASAFPAFSAGGAPAAAQPKPAKADLAKGEASYTAVCAACHAADGNSTIPLQPKLAGQHPEYLVKQLMEFKDDKRKDPVMKGFASMLSEPDMKNIAGWLHAQKPKDGFAKDKDLVAMGERIYRGGIQERNIAACAGCHSPNGAGIPAQYPRLAGQHADYTATQLTAFRDGKRANSIQMTQVAAKLNDREIKAVADYIAGLR